MEKIEIDDKAISLAVADAIDLYGDDRKELVEILHHLTHKFGYLPGQVFVELSKAMCLTVGEIYSVASFYTMLLTKPRGKHLVQFCESAPCHVAGSESLLTMLKDVLGIGPGETSKNGHWTLIKTSCFGQCAEGPILVIDDTIYSRVNRERLWHILAQYEKGDREDGE